MPRKEKPAPPPIDWAEFVEAVRIRELSRRFNRPSQMLERHSQTWREPPPPLRFTWLGTPWLTEKQKVERDEARRNLFERMRGVSRGKRS